MMIIMELPGNSSKKQCRRVPKKTNQIDTKTNEYGLISDLYHREVCSKQTLYYLDKSVISLNIIYLFFTGSFKDFYKPYSFTAIQQQRAVTEVSKGNGSLYRHLIISCGTHPARPRTCTVWLAAAAAAPSVAILSLAVEFLQAENLYRPSHINHIKDLFLSIFMGLIFNISS